MNEPTLGESERRFRQLAESINLVFWLVDANKHEMLYISPSYEVIWGRSRASLVEAPSSWLEAILPQDRGRIQDAVTRQAIDDYDVEYRIQRPDGEIRWIRDRAYPVLDDSGRLCRIAGVAEDITEKKHAQLGHAKSKETLAAICAAQSRFIREPGKPAALDELLKATLELTQSGYGFIGEVPRKPDGTPYLKQCIVARSDGGLIDIDQCRTQDLAYRDLDTWYEALLAGGQPLIVNEAAHAPRTSGLPGAPPAVSTFLGLPLFDGENIIGLIGLANRPDGYPQTICQELESIATTCASLLLANRNHDTHKQAEENLRLMQFAVDNSKVSLFWISPEARVLKVNDYACKNLGYTQDELIGKHISDIDPDYGEHVSASIWAKLRQEGVTTFERRHRRKDGSVFPIQSTANYISYEGQEYSFSIIQDISEKKEKEKQILFLNQIYDAVSRTNQALLECADEEALYRRVCQIAVGYGGMKMAWVGKRDEASELIKPVASHGEGTGYLNDLVISARADAVEGRGPSGVAFREHRVVIVQDFDTDPITAPWHEHGRRYGWGASAAIGILRGGEPHAVLTFYHPEKNSFTAKITELMAEMSANISFGLDRFDLAVAQRQAMRALEEGAHRYHEIIETAMDGFWVVDTEGLLLEVNDTYVQRSGYSREELLRMRIPDLDVTMDEADIAERLEGMKTVGHVRFETKHRAKDGSIWPVEVSKVYLPQNGGRHYAFIRDISERYRAEEELRVAATVFNAQEAMMVTDADGNILRVNQAFSKITGYSAAEVMGKNPSIMQSGRHGKDFYIDMWEKIEKCGSWQGEIWDKRKNGEIYPKWLSISSVKGHDGEVSHYVGSFTDITAYKKTQDEVVSLAFYDQLTELPNRRLLLDRLQHALAASNRNKLFGALLYIDLDHFKNINDTQGHDVGDVMLQEIARRLRLTVREQDTIARLGGDEFVVLLEELSADQEHAATQAKLVGGKLMDTLRHPYTLQGKEYPASISIGVALFRNLDSGGIHEILKRADMAMYEAKKAGRNTLRFFDPAMQIALENRAWLESDLREASAEGRFILLYQRQVNSQGRIMGAETLLRWRHPERDLLTPKEFIGLSEETGLILPIGQWVLKEACHRLKAWESRPDTSKLMLSVNVSAREFKQENFVDNVMRILKETGAKPSLLELEITESMLLDNIDEFIEKMRVLRDAGVSFALDDFGTGYSSLSYLKKLPLNRLKIDQSFVQDLEHDPNDEAIVQTIIQMGQTLGLEVIAEGVETQAQCTMLEQYGCHHFQGYLFGAPTSLDSFEQALDSPAPTH